MRNIYSYVKKGFSIVRDLFRLELDEDDDVLTFECPDGVTLEDDEIPMNKYRFTFDLEIPAEEAEDSINLITKRIMRQIERVAYLNGAELDTMEITPVCEFKVSYAHDDESDNEETPTVTSAAKVGAMLRKGMSNVAMY